MRRGRKGHETRYHAALVPENVASTRCSTNLPLEKSFRILAGNHAVKPRVPLSLMKKGGKHS